MYKLIHKSLKHLMAYLSHFFQKSSFPKHFYIPLAYVICTTAILNSSDVFKICFAVSLLLFVCFSFFIKDVKPAIITFLCITAPLLKIGKFYSIPLFGPQELRWANLLDQGFSLTYGLSLSDIFTMISVLILIRMYVLHRKHSENKAIDKLAASGRKYPLFQRILVSFLLFFVFLFFSSVTVASFPTYSLVTAMQLVKILPTFLLFFFWLSTEKKASRYLMWLIWGIIVCQFVMVLFQVLSEAIHLTNAQAVMAYSIEERNIFFRPSGIFYHANQLSFSILCLQFTSTLLTFGQKLTKREEQSHTISWLLTIIVLILSQTRVVWFIVICQFLALIAATGVNRLISKIRVSRKNILWGVVFSIIFATIIFTRIMSTAFSNEGGSATIRLKMIKEAVAVLRESPVYGFGAGNNVETMMRYFPNGYILDFPAEIHMAYLQIALYSGLFGSFFFFLPWILVLYSSEKNVIRFYHSQIKINSDFVIKAGVFFVLLYYLFHVQTGHSENFFMIVFLATMTWLVERQCVIAKGGLK